MSKEKALEVSTKTQEDVMAPESISGLGKIFPEWADHGSSPDFPKLLLSNFDDLCDQAQQEGRALTSSEKAKLRGFLEWQIGENVVAVPYFEKITEAELAVHMGREHKTREGGRTKRVYRVGGFFGLGGKQLTEADARQRAEWKIWDARLDKLVLTMEALDRKAEQSGALSPAEAGEYHAAYVLFHIVHNARMGMPLVDGFAGQIAHLEASSREFEGLDTESARDALSGVIGSGREAEGERVLPSSAELRFLGQQNEVVQALSGGPASYFVEMAVGNLARGKRGLIVELVEKLTGGVPTAVDLALGDGLDLGKAAEARIDRATQGCALSLVRDFELGQHGRTDGLDGLRNQLGKRQEVFTRAIRNAGQEKTLALASVLDRTFRKALSTLRNGIPTGGQFSPGFVSWPEPQEIVALSRDLVGIGSIQRGFDVSSIADDLQRERVSRLRQILGASPMNATFDDYLGTPGFLPFYSWEVTNGGTWKDAQKRAISWVPEDPLTEQQVELTQHSLVDWLGDHVSNVADHLQAQKTLGLDFDLFVKDVLAEDLVLREGIDMASLAREIAQIDDFDEIRGAIGRACDLVDARSPLRPTLRVVLERELTSLFLHEEGVVGSPDYKIAKRPIIGIDGRLMAEPLWDEHVPKGYGGVEAWDELAKQSGLFKHLGPARARATILLMEGAYNRYYEAIRADFFSHRDLPTEIDGKVVASRGFLRYKTLESLRMDFTTSTVVSIRAFLAQGDSVLARYSGSFLNNFIRRENGSVYITGLPPADQRAVREAILVNMGIDIERGFPDVGYPSWRRNLLDLIENARRYGYSRQQVAALEGIRDRDPVFLFKKRLAEELKDQLISDGIDRLQDGNVTVEDLMKEYAQKMCGLLSERTSERGRVREWGGDKLAATVREELSKAEGKPSRRIERWAVGLVDFLHGPAKDEKPPSGIFGKALYFFKRGDYLSTFMIGSAVGLAVDALVFGQYTGFRFHALPIIDSFLVRAFPQLSFLAPPVGLNIPFAVVFGLQLILPRVGPLNFFKAQSYQWQRFIEDIDKRLRLRGEKGVMSDRERALADKK